MTIPPELLPIAVAALAALLVAWNLAEGARLASAVTLPRRARLVSGLAAFSCIPAWLATVLAELPAGARILEPLAWLWPLTALAFVVQSSGLLHRASAHRAVRVAAGLFNLIVAWVVIVAWLARLGVPLASWVLLPGASWARITARLFGDGAYTVAPLTLFPMLAPMLPARSRLSKFARTVLMSLAYAVCAACLWQAPSAWQVMQRTAAAPVEPARERSRGDFSLGLQLFGALQSAPSPTIARPDVALADSLGITLVQFTLSGDALLGSALDSISRTIEARRDSLLVVVQVPPLIDSIAVMRLMTRLRPDVVATPPAASTANTDDAMRGLLRLARIARRIDRNVSVALITTARTTRDSALVDRVNAGQTAVDGIALVGAPGPETDMRYRNAMATLDRWAALHRSPAPVWLLGIPAAPVVDGASAQQHLARHVLQWGSAHPYVRGVSLGDLSDGWRTPGLRRLGGRARPALAELGASLRALRDTPAADSTSDAVPVVPDTLPPSPDR